MSTRTVQRTLPEDTERVLPTARLSLRVIADQEGPGLVAQWLDDRSGRARMVVLARRDSAQPWVMPTTGIADDQLAIGLAAVLDAMRAAPAARLYLDVPRGGRQSGLTWPAMLEVSYDALDPVTPARYTASLLDLEWDGPEVARERMRVLADRLRGGRTDRSGVTPVPSLLIEAEREGSPVMARAVAAVAGAPESTLLPSGPHLAMPT